MQPLATIRTYSRFYKVKAIFAISLLLILAVGAGLAQAAGPVYPQAIFVPCDDRPSTKLFPTQIARIAGGQLVVPTKTEIGNAYTPGDPEALAQWLTKQTQGGKRDFIISADMLVYGGLWHSRKAGISQEQALERLQTLRLIRPKAGKVIVYASLPRLDLSTSEAAEPHQQALSNWATKASYANLQFSSTVPQEISEEYMAVRRRNVQVIMALIDMVQDGTIDELTIGQDDSHKTGLNVDEQAQVNAHITKANLHAQVSMMNGADELGMCLVAGWLSDYWHCHPHFQVKYTDPQAALEIPKLESRPVKETVAKHIALCGAYLDPEQKPSEKSDVALIWIATQSDKPYAGTSGESEEAQAQRAAETEALIKQYRQNGRRLGIADTRLINQADPVLATQVLDHTDLWTLEGYAAWNTPANTIGTILAQMTAYEIYRQCGAPWDQLHKVESAKTQVAFTLARLIDDYAYQAMIRPSLSQEAKKLPRNPDPLLNVYGGLGMNARQSTIKWTEDIWQSKLKDKCFSVPHLGYPLRFDSYKLEVVLPWQRVFEIEARLDVRLHLMTASEAKAYRQQQEALAKQAAKARTTSQAKGTAPSQVANQNQQAKQQTAAGQDNQAKQKTTATKVQDEKTKQEVIANKQAQNAKKEAAAAKQSTAKQSASGQDAAKTKEQAKSKTTKDTAQNAATKAVTGKSKGDVKKKADLTGQLIEDPVETTNNTINATTKKANHFLDDPVKATGEAVDEAVDAVKDTYNSVKKALFGE